ncbi:MAG: hypothetical protein ACOYKE_08920 [Ferruginibacter sp.]
MNKQQEDQFIRQIMESTDGMQRASANPFLLTVLNQKIQQQPKNNWEYLGMYIAKPAVWVSAIFLVVLLNGAALWKNTHSVANTENTVLVANDDEAESFAIIDQIENQEP